MIPGLNKFLLDDDYSKKNNIIITYKCTLWYELSLAQCTTESRKHNLNVLVLFTLRTENTECLGLWTEFSLCFSIVRTQIYLISILSTRSVQDSNKFCYLVRIWCPDKAKPTKTYNMNVRLGERLICSVEFTGSIFLGWSPR